MSLDPPREQSRDKSHDLVPNGRHLRVQHTYSSTMISALLTQQERRRGRRVLRQHDGAPEVGDDLVSAGLRPSSGETRSRGKTVEVCGRAAVEKSSQISPKTSVYIGGRGGALPWGSRSPKGVGRAKGGRSPPPKPSWTWFGGWESFLPFPPPPFFSFSLIFLPMRIGPFWAVPPAH